MQAYLCKLYAFQNGFLRSSPKIIIHINLEKQKANNQPGVNIEEGGNNIWACPICFFSNKASSDACELCGVKKVKTPVTTPTTQSNPVDQDSSICVVCTFMNHPSMIQCEMCGADLPREIVPAPSTSSASATTPEPDPQVKISFRNGGQSNLLSKLKAAVNDKQWEEVMIMESIRKVTTFNIVCHRVGCTNTSCRNTIHS